MIKIPQLTYLHNDHGYALAGWDEFNQYGRLNWPLWRHCLDITNDQMTEIDRLRFMLATHALEFERAKNEYANLVERKGP